MSEKIFNARFAQKIDTLTAWASSNIVLKAGEIAFATESVDTTVDGVAIKQPIVLAKIGDGSKTFSQLPYSFYAKASDVHSWAKASKAPDELDTKYSFALVDGKLQITETTYTDGVAGAPNVLPLIDVATQEELNAVETALNTKIGDLAKLATENKTDLVTAINEVRQAVEVGGTGSVVTITDANANKVTTYTVKQGETEVKKILVPDAYDDTDVRALAQKGVDDAATAAGAVETLKTTEVKANADAIAGLSENKADKATTLAGYGIGDAYTKTETEGKISDAITTFTNAYITSDGGAIDKLQEIANWIDSDKNGAADIIADVEANAGAIEDIVDGTTTVAKATHAVNADTATNAGHADIAGDATKLNGQDASYYATAQDIVTINTNFTEGNLVAGKAEKDAAGNIITDTYFTKSEMMSFTNDLINGSTVVGKAEKAEKDADGNVITTTYATKQEVTTLDDSLAPVAKSGEIADLKQSANTDEIIFDAGNASGYSNGWTPKANA